MIEVLTRKKEKCKAPENKKKRPKVLLVIFQFLRGSVLNDQVQSDKDLP